MIFLHCVKKPKDNTPTDFLFDSLKASATAEKFLEPITISFMHLERQKFAYLRLLLSLMTL
jgi:hypothetical protein